MLFSAHCHQSGIRVGHEQYKETTKKRRVSSRVEYTETLGASRPGDTGVFTAHVTTLNDALLLRDTDSNKKHNQVLNARVCGPHLNDQH